MPSSLYPAATALLTSLVLVSTMVGCTPRSVAPKTVSPFAIAEQAIRADASNAGLRRSYAKALLEAGRKFEALQQFGIVCELPGSDDRDRLRFAETLSDLGEFEEAARVLQAALARSPNSVEIRAGLAQTQFKLGQFFAAQRTEEPLLHRSDTMDAATRSAVLLHCAFGRQPERVLSAIRDTEIELLPTRALALYRVGDYRQCVKVSLRRLEAAPQDYDAAYLMALAYLRAGDRTRALAIWRQLVSAPESSPRAIYHVAALLAESGRAADAAALLKRPGADAASDPLYWEAWRRTAPGGRPAEELIDRGYAAFHSGLPLEAEGFWKQALLKANAEDRRELYAALYNSAFRRHDTDAALLALEQALRVRPEDAFFLKRKAETLLGQNRLVDALQTAKELQRVAPSDMQSETAELLSRIALDSGQPQLLEEQTRARMRFEPTDPDPYLHLAEWQGQLGKRKETTESALALYQKAIGVAPENAEAHARAGMALADLGREDEATAEILRALTLSPRVLEGAANARLAQLYGARGMRAEQQFQLARYELLQRSKVSWPALLKALRSDRPFSEWMELGRAALERREDWIALCASRRCVTINPAAEEAWEMLAAVNKRLGRLDETLDALQQAAKAGRPVSGHTPAPSSVRYN